MLRKSPAPFAPVLLPGSLVAAPPVAPFSRVMETESARLEHASPWSERRDCRPDSWLTGPVLQAWGSTLLSPRSLPRIAREQPAKCDFGQPVDEMRPLVSS